MFFRPRYRAAVSLYRCSSSLLLVLMLVETIVAGPPAMVSGDVDGRTVRGLSVVDAINRRIVLGHDGWLHDFDPRAKSHRLQPLEGKFQPIDTLELRTQLYEEFGRDYDYSATRNYLIVQPKGSSSRWPDVFEQLHRTFVSYFKVRGMTVRQGNFPMVAIVMRDEASMQRYLRSIGVDIGDVVGIYDRHSNRIVMYDHGPGSGGIEATICHEAAHQSAFNTGVQNRLSDTPHWIVEGVGCLFQSPAMIEGRRGAKESDRCDPGLLLSYQSELAGRPDKIARQIELLVSSDQPFIDRGEMHQAYALSWAMTFYLADRMPSEFIHLLEKYGDLPPFQSYQESQRLSDFTVITGMDPQIFAQRLERFMSSFQ